MIHRTSQTIARRRTRLGVLLASLRRNTSGVALVEFALTLPVLTAMGMYGVEIAYMSSVNMQMSQMALELADNASRMQQTNNSTVAPTVTETDIDTIMSGVIKRGENFRFAQNGRVILSSLEKDPATGKQFIHWQRCAGSLLVPSAYGNDSDSNGLNGGTLTGMGSGSTKAIATTGIAVMFVELTYDYSGIFGTLFVNNVRFRQEASYIVRDLRDLRASNVSGVTGSGGSSQC
ncbi:MAG: TadE/TadG family type IV pilus assembly protein [Pseudomonadota bacterium]